MNNFLKKSVVLSIFSITALSSIDSMAFGSGMAERLERLRELREEARQTADENANGIATEYSLVQSRRELDDRRTGAIDAAFGEIKHANDQIEQLVVLTRQRNLDLVTKRAAYEAATNAITGLAGKISALRISAASSEENKRALEAAESQLRHYEEVANDLSQTLTAATGD